MDLWGRRDFVLASMRAGFWQKFTVKDGDDGAGRAKGKRRDEKKRVLRIIGQKGRGPDGGRGLSYSSAALW